MVHRWALFGVQHEAVLDDAGHSQVFVRLGQSQEGGAPSRGPACTSCDQVVQGQSEGVDIAGLLHSGAVEYTVFPI